MTQEDYDRLKSQLVVLRQVAKEYQGKTIALEYNNRETPKWVRQWYERLGYEEKVFGRYYSLMVKQIE